VSYLKTHGDPGWESHVSYLDRVVPRVLDVLDRLALRITVFVVARTRLKRAMSRHSGRSPPPGTKSAITRTSTSRGCICIRQRSSKRN